MHISFLSDIRIKKHLSPPGIAEEALQLVQNMKTQNVRVANVDADHDCETMGLTGVTFRPGVIAALNAIVAEVKQASKGTLRGEIAFSSDPALQAIFLNGPAFDTGGKNAHQLPRVLAETEQRLSQFISSQKPAKREPRS